MWSWERPLPVQVVQRFHELFRNLSNLFFRQRGVILQYLKQLALRELGHHAKLGFGFERIHHGDYVFVFQAFQ